MAYVRMKGNQVAVVHGQRDPETKKVDQQTLFTLYSKAEGRAALGDERQVFQMLLEQEHPRIKFDWKKIEGGIREHLDRLPDIYPYQQERLEGRFRQALCGFAKELLLADPQSLISSARLIQSQRHELEYLRDIIHWRLELSDQEDNQWNKDTPFYWRTLARRREVPPDEWEKLGELFAKGLHDEVEALAGMLVECWPNFARGHNYLGLVDIERGDLEEAVVHFEMAEQVGRTLFPKRIRRERYWSDHDTRPYIRAIIWQAQARNRLGQADEALRLCDRLERECGQEITAATERIPPLLNSGRWEAAAEAATVVHRIYPQENFCLAFALFELGQRREALVHFLHATIRFPRSARMLTGARKGGPPKTSDDVRDHNAGVGFLRDLDLYLGARSRMTRAFFKRLVVHDEVARLVAQAQEARRRWHEDRSGDRTWFERMNRIESIEFARQEAEGLTGLTDLTDPAG